MPRARARPTSTLPPEPHLSDAGSTPNIASGAPANIDLFYLFERAFAEADAAAPLGSAYPAVREPERGFLALLARLGAAIGRWLEPRCANCAARGTVALELRAVADGEAPRLWERCYVCNTTWASVRCEDYSGWC